MLRHKVTTSQKQIMGFIRREVRRALKYDKFPGYVTHDLLGRIEQPLNIRPTQLGLDEVYTLIIFGLGEGAANYEEDQE